MPAQDTLTQSSCSSGVKLNLVADAEQQPGLPDDVPMHMFPILLRSQQLELDDQLVPTNLAGPEPTARDILQGIKDLSRRFDLLATNKQVEHIRCPIESMSASLPLCPDYAVPG
ncbi:hypothetical protein BDR06DRAFT_1004757 [Suillus hirtellus]|nr:hypothetical protein BDR06DRAFT_1004757 [Suillus hirtellus]